MAPIAVDQSFSTTQTVPVTVKAISSQAGGNDAKPVDDELPVDWEPTYRYAWALPHLDSRYKDPNVKDPPYEPFEQ